MPQDFQPGDFLIFQLESGYGLLRVLDVEGDEDDPVWHLAAYRDLFLDIDMADSALENPDSLTVELPHVALTNRAFESTQTAKMLSVPFTDAEKDRIYAEKRSGDIATSDRSIRLLLGLR
jgi:hypothetical protein